MPDRSPLVVVIDRLIRRSALSPADALAALQRAATRRGVTVEVLAADICRGGSTHAGALRAENARLRAALEERDILGQAKGILMERHGIDAAHALDRLVEMSQHGDLALGEVAASLVELRADVPDPGAVPDLTLD